MTHQKLFDHMSQETTINKLKSGKYNCAWVAVRLYRGIKERSAISKLHNKLHNIGGRSLSITECIEIEKILK